MSNSNPSTKKECKCLCHQIRDIRKASMWQRQNALANGMLTECEHCTPLDKVTTGTEEWEKDFDEIKLTKCPLKGRCPDCQAVKAFFKSMNTLKNYLTGAGIVILTLVLIITLEIVREVWR